MLKGRKAKTAEQQMIEDFTNDMQASQERGQLEAQASEFKAFLIEQTSKAKKNEFFASMLEKMNDGVILTDNMVNALRKCVTRQAEWDAQKQQKASAPKVKRTFRMKAWWCKANNMSSRAITCEIEGETEKAFKVKAHGDIVNGCWCMRCGQELTQPASFTIGFGETCASHIGIPYPAELNSMTKAQIKKYREQLLGVVQAQVYDGWLPKSQIVEELTP